MRTQKALIVNPYWETLGGGERYCASVANCLLRAGWQVDVVGSDSLPQAVQTRFGIDIAAAQFVHSEVYTAHYDVVFWLSDGSIPLSFARKTLVHFQFPFTHLRRPSLLTTAKLKLYTIVCNSMFTKSRIDQQFNISSDVLYPPIDTTAFLPQKKLRKILYVGRFSQLTQKKNPHLLLDAYEQLSWKSVKLTLAGGVGVGADKEYFDKLKSRAKTLGIEVVENPNLTDLRKLYGQASIFWSASGMQIDEQIHPTQVEHFGMSVVEAMSAGCVPIISAAGGHREIITEGVNGYLVTTPEELAKKTHSLLQDPAQLANLSQAAIARSQDFAVHQFNRKLLQLVS